MPQKYRGQSNGYSIVKSHIFSVAYRLLREDGFDRLVHSDNFSDKYFKVYFARNNKSNARLGIIASKKVFSRATERNRIKRVIREAFRQHGISAKHLDIVVMVRHACSQQPSTRYDNLGSLLSRVENRCAEL